MLDGEKNPYLFQGLLFEANSKNSNRKFGDDHDEPNLETHI